MLLIWVAIAALLGGLSNALLGWTQTDQPFVWRKFWSSAIASFIGAVVVAVSFNYTGAEDTGLISFLTSLFVGFLSGAGVSAGASRVAGSIK
jgi:hypothetical protein